MARHAPPAVLDPNTPAEHAPTTGGEDLGPLAATTEVDDGFEWLRADTLRVLLYALAGVLWLVLVRYLAQPDAFWPGWGSALLALAVVAGAHALAPRSYPLASGVLIAGLAIIVTARTVGGIHDGVALFLYIPVVLMAGTLQRTRAAVLVASLATATLVGHVAYGTATIGLGAALEVLAVIWLTALTSWLVTRNLYTALHWSWQSQELARRPRPSPGGLLRGGRADVPPREPVPRLLHGERDAGAVLRVGKHHAPSRRRDRGQPLPESRVVVGGGRQLLAPRGQGGATHQAPCNLSGAHTRLGRPFSPDESPGRPARRPLVGRELRGVPGHAAAGTRHAGVPSSRGAGRVLGGRRGLHVRVSRQHARRRVASPRAPRLVPALSPRSPAMLASADEDGAAIRRREHHPVVGVARRTSTGHGRPWAGGGLGVTQGRLAADRCAARELSSSRHLEGGPLLERRLPWRTASELTRGL